MKRKNGSTWWIRLKGCKPAITNGERELFANDEDTYLTSQEHMDASRLIQAGMATGDKETVNIRRARMRVLLGRELPEDLDFFRY
jgi:hypothetical protein